MLAKLSGVCETLGGAGGGAQRDDSAPDAAAWYGALGYHALSYHALS